MMATTQVQIYPPPFNVLPFRLSDRISLSLSPFSLLFLSLLASRAIFCWHFASIAALFDASTLPLSLIQPPLLQHPIWVRFFGPPATFTQHAFIQRFPSSTRTRPYVCPFIRPVFASVSRLTHLRPISLLARCDDEYRWSKLGSGTEIRDIKPSQPVAVCHWWGLY